MSFNEIQRKRAKKVNDALWYLVEFQECSEETSNTFRSFIDNGADINFVNTSEDSNTLLHMAVLLGKKEWLQLLVDSGADQGIKNVSDKTPIDMALELMNHEAVQILRPSVDNLIKKLNNYLQVYDGLKNSSLFFDYHACFEEIFDQRDNIFMKCSHPQMLLAGFVIKCHQEGSFNLDSSHIFMKLSQVNSDNLEMVQQAIRSSKNAKIFLIESNYAAFSEMLKFLNVDSRIVLISSRECEIETNFPEKNYLNLTWSHLSHYSQLSFLSSNSIQFQGQVVKLEEIMETSTEIFDDLPLEDVLTKIPGMNLASKAATSSKLEFYVSRKVSMEYYDEDGLQTLIAGCDEEFVVRRIRIGINVYYLHAPVGSGSTTWAMKIADLFAQRHRNRWVVFVDVRKLGDLSIMQKKVEFLLNFPKCDSELERRMFQHFCDNEKVFFIFNGVTNGKVLKTIQQEIGDVPSNNCLIISKHKGWDRTQTSFKFEPMEFEEQMAILSVARRARTTRQLKDESITELQKMFENLKNHFGAHFGTPGYALLLNEVFAEVEAPQQLSIKQLFTLIVRKKVQMLSRGFRTEDEERELIESLISMHHGAALMQLFSSSKLTNLNLVDIDHRQDGLIESIGFLSIIEDSPDRFVTLTLAHFFAADFILSNTVNAGPLNSSCFLHDLFLEVLRTSEFKKVRFFMNYLLENKDPNETIVTTEMSKKLGESLINPENYGTVTNLVMEQLSRLLTLILKDYDYEATTKLKLLTHKDDDGKTVLNHALNADSIDFLQNFLSAIETIPKSDCAKILLSGDFGGNLFAEVLSKYSVDVIRTVIGLASKTLTREDLKEFFTRSSSFLLFTGIRSAETFMVVWEALSQVLTPDEQKNIFMERDEKRSLLLHFAEADKPLEVGECICKISETIFNPQEMKDFLLLTDHNGHSALHLAIEMSNTVKVERILEIYQSKLDQKSMKALLLSEAIPGQSLLQFAVSKQNVVTSTEVDKILMTAVEVLSPKELKSFLTSEDLFGRTLLHATAGKIEIFAIIWQFVSNILSADEQTAFMLKKNLAGCNFFSSVLAIRKSDVGEVSEFFSQVLTEHEITLLSDLEQVRHVIGIIEKILEEPHTVLTKLNNSYGHDNIFHLALRYCTSQVLSELFGAMEQNLTKREIFNLAILKNKFEGMSSLSYALKNLEELAVTNFWNFLTSALSNDECIQVVLCTCDNVFHEFASTNPKLLLKIIDWFNINCSDQSVHTKIYCERDSEQRTLIHVVAQHFDKDLIDCFFAFVKRILNKDQLQTMLLTKGGFDQNCFNYVGKNTKEGAFDAFLDNIKIILSPEDVEKLVLEGGEDD